MSAGPPGLLEGLLPDLTPDLLRVVLSGAAVVGLPAEFEGLALVAGWRVVVPEGLLCLEVLTEDDLEVDDLEVEDCLVCEEGLTAELFLELEELERETDWLEDDLFWEEVLVLELLEVVRVVPLLERDSLLLLCASASGRNATSVKAANAVASVVLIFPIINRFS